MNSASVFKNLEFIEKDERVRIPDVELLHIEGSEHIEGAEQATSEYEDEITSDEDFETEDTESGAEKCENGEVIQEAEEEKLPEFEPEPEPEPLPQYPSGEELRQIYEQELSAMCEDFAQQAYYDALNRKKAELRDTIAEVSSLMDELSQNHRDFIEEYTEELKFMAVDIAEKMIHEKIDEDDLILQRLVLHTIKSVRNTEWMNVELSDRLASLVDSIKAELEKPEYEGKAHVVPIAGTDDVCRVTMQDGTIVCTISTQAENLREAFRQAQG
ncbi:MAG: hypothetical protein GX025_10445 [Clostridiales bacterium]|nr:hypothetical protein [Clostridiales bacterium]